jgi:8-oxo-dGTP pyrophosphatase MutT (NUDIX family)
MALQIRLSGKPADAAQAFYGAKRHDPAEPREAVTVVLVRDGAQPAPGELEVFFMRRAPTMSFAGGMPVFPGGRVDERDNEAVRWIGPDPEEWARRLDTSPALARALVCAAVRETFEEAGVLLAGHDAETVADCSGPEWAAERGRLERHEISLSEFLAEHDLAVRTDLLAPWSQWLTPEFEPRRYRTRFLLAGVPAGQEPLGGSSESVETYWISVHAALGAADSGPEFRIAALLPPQYFTCLDLYDHATVEEALSASRSMEWVLPSAELRDGSAYLALPEAFAATRARVRSLLRARGTLDR